MANQTFYSRGDKKLTSGSNTAAVAQEFENERDILDTAFQGVQDADEALDSRIAALEGAGPATEFIDQTVAFNDQTASAPQVRVAPSTLGRTMIGGFASCQPGTAPGASIDITLGGPSIISGPIPVGVSPGVAIPFAFTTPGIAAGVPLTFILSDGGGLAIGCTVTAQATTP